MGSGWNGLILVMTREDSSMLVLSFSLLCLVIGVCQAVSWLWVCCSPASVRLVFTQSSLVEQSTPVSHQIYDAAFSVSGRGVSDEIVKTIYGAAGGR